MAPDSPKAQQDRARRSALTPFLRWAGGKRWFVRDHTDLIPTRFRTYIEPFLGSGVVFFHLRPERALLTDANRDLVTAFLGIRDQPTEVMRHLLAHAASHGAEHYRLTREADPPLLAERAARIIYLNRACFNGVYRVNLQGRFNVPMGDRRTIVYDTDDFHTLSEALQGAEIGSSDFEIAVDRASSGDLVFADPPYTVRHNNNGFIKYNETLFSWDDQERLVKSLARAVDRGAKVLATNAAHDSVRDLYTGHGFAFTEVSRFSAIAASGENRRQYTEIVISSP